MKMATPTKIRKGLIRIVGLLSFLISNNLASAETRVFVEEYTYQASEADSKLSSRVIAFEQVKRLLLEKLGTYLESETEVKNFQIEKDQIVILTSGIVSAEMIEERWDGKTYYLKGKITADPKEIASSIDKFRQNRQKTKELEDTRKKANEALREIEKLKKELETAKGEKLNLGEYNEAVNRLSATDWVAKGYVLGNAFRAQEAIKAFTKAIELDPKLALAYFNRGAMYNYLGNHQQAISNYDRVIEFHPKLTNAYFYRGNSYRDLGDYRRAIKDYDRVIELDPKYVAAYTCRAIVYRRLGDHRQAIRDETSVIELSEPGPVSAISYGDRGVDYVRIGNYRQAIRDLNIAIQMFPDFPKFYYSRGIAYEKLGEHGQAIEDYKTAAKLGYRPAQELLKAKGLSW